MSELQSIDSKIVLLGATSVGKTSIICRAVSDEFDAEMPATIGACYTAKQIELDKVSVNLQIWDTAGQERFRTLAPMYYRGSIVALLVFSLIEESSLNDVKSWAQEMKAQTDEMPTIFVIGNKMDLVDERTITTEQGEAVAKELGAFYYEVSAKSGRGIEELFVRIAEESAKKLAGDNSTGGSGHKKDGVNIKEGEKEGKKKCGC
ncbi:small GTP-binding protein [Histomonas meleagridis]|uniref:small GTP-binding protein n=1 Tax=Histomonas meleagridis TaxID=135588 RepID=UPI003559C442|nr:small GTP-binding protein [Histomonas meleagridis]KAH0797950.1 small GTP-binding protein [Histomonas meleagridis]